MERTELAAPNVGLEPLVGPLACPCCGAYAKAFQASQSMNPRVKCGGCGLCVFKRDLPSAVAAWNLRVKPNAQVQPTPRSDGRLNLGVGPGSEP